MIQTKTMFTELSLFEYVKSKIICLVIGHDWCGGFFNFDMQYDIRDCCRCCDTRVLVDAPITSSNKRDRELAKSRKGYSNSVIRLQEVTES